jgi:hypothetical protein
MMLTFILFLVLGLAVFMSPPPGNMRTVLMIVFIVLMVLWIAAGISGFNLDFPKK